MRPDSAPPTASSLEDLLRGLRGTVRDMVREELPAAVRATLGDLPGSAPKFTTIAAYARRAGFSASTLRRMVRSAGASPAPPPEVSEAAAALGRRRGAAGCRDEAATAAGSSLARAARHGERRRYLTAELDQIVASGAKSLAPAAPPVDLAERRARAAASSLTTKGGR